MRKHNKNCNTMFNSKATERWEANLFQGWKIKAKIGFKFFYFHKHFRALTSYVEAEK